MDYDHELDEEEIIQQQQQTASTSPINTGQSCNRSGFFLTGTGTGRKGQTGPGRPVDRHD